MYTPVDDQDTIDKRISKFIERKSSHAPWVSLKKTLSEWRTSTVDQPKDDIAYEPIDWQHSSYGRSGYRKLAS